MNGGSPAFTVDKTVAVAVGDSLDFAVGVFICPDIAALRATVCGK